MQERRLWILVFVMLVYVSFGESGPQSLQYRHDDHLRDDEGGDLLEAKEEMQVICPPLRFVCPHPDITFHLYTGQGAPLQLHEDRLSEAALAFLPGAPLKLLLHDYDGDRHDSFNTLLRQAYARRGPYNLVSVEWRSLARAPCVGRASLAAELVGVCLGRMVEALGRAPPPAGRSPDALHVLAFGLGAAAASHAARCLPGGGRIGRITGLDPLSRSLVEPEGFHKLHRLVASDAVFVDVVHTSASVRAPLAAAPPPPMGHVDFYVNGGAAQPACATPRLYANASAAGASVFERLACSHALAPVYFAESLASAAGFWGSPCAAQTRPAPSAALLASDLAHPLAHQSIATQPPAPRPPPVLMGEDAPFSASGVLCVTTRARAPYALGRVGSEAAPAPPPPPPPPAPAPLPSRSLLFDALGLLLAALFFFLAARYAATAAAVDWCRQRAQRRLAAAHVLSAAHRKKGQAPLSAGAGLRAQRAAREARMARDSQVAREAREALAGPRAFCPAAAKCAAGLCGTPRFQADSDSDDVRRLALYCDMARKRFARRD